MLDFTNAALSAIAPIQVGEFTFVINGMTVKVNLSDAVALSPAVALGLSIDSCVRTFIIEEAEVDATSISSFSLFLSSQQRLLRPASDSIQRSLSLLFGRLLNSSLELDFLFPLPGDCVPSLPNSVSLLSLDAVECLLRDRRFCIESEDRLFEWILGLGADFFPLLRHVRWDLLRPGVPCDFEMAASVVPDESVWAEMARLLYRAARPLIDSASLIVSDFPPPFTEFQWKRFTLLWRGSRDGFGARDFHARCDGHANTLTLVEDSKGNIFGGFTPVEWESRARSKSDPSLKSFLLTLKNPHNVPPMRFPLNPVKKHEAIWCDPSWGPQFGGGFAVCDDATTRSDSYAQFFGQCYANHTGINGKLVLTGSANFTVKEIEVFEITD
jgi:hypothetical protein